MTVPQNYLEVTDYLSSRFEEVNGYDFYREVFPNNESSGELNEDFSKPNAIYLYTDERDKDSKRRMRRRVMLDDTWEDDYLEFVEGNEGTLCSGLAYRGRTNKLEHAHRCMALIIDLDGVGLKEIRNLFLRFGKEQNMLGRMLPMPTYLVCSGTGLHIYYVLEEPIDLFPNIKSQLKSMKHDLTFKAWDYKATSQQKNIQYQSINQGFRMVGSVNSKYGVFIKAYKIGEKVSVETLNSYVSASNRLDLEKRFRPSKMTLSQAKIKFPDWYNRLYDENGNKRKDVRLKKWDIAGKVNGDDPFALYHWWLRKAEQVKGGHRYFYLMCLAIYACKCDVPKSKLKRDMDDVFEILKNVEHANPLTRADMDSALESFSKEFYNFTIDDISKLTDIFIQRNKRNGQKQADHLEEARAIRDIRMRRQKRKWTDGNGRHSAEQKVTEYRAANPNGKKADCIRGTGLSKPTVYKWWEVAEMNNLRKYTNRSEMAKLSPKEQQEKALQIWAAVEKIQREHGISEDEAYRVFVTGKTEPEHKEISIPESEVGNVMMALMSSGNKNVRSIRVLSDEEYEEEIAEGFCDWLIKQR